MPYRKHTLWNRNPDPVSAKRVGITFVLSVILITALCLVIFNLPRSASTGSHSAVKNSSGVTFADHPGASAEPGEDVSRDAEDELPEDLTPLVPDSEAVPLDTIPGSITALVNRAYRLPSSYVPKDLVNVKVRFSFDYSSDKRKLRKEAARALEKMFREAKKTKKIILYGVSGYRSYKRQQQIYLYNIAHRGRHATNSVSALPGSSEHQTGLTMDISAQSVDLELVPAFGRTREGKWVAKNAHRFGFIIRYPKSRSKITGYSYEPWHLRYVGTATATYLYQNNLTLEEYYGKGK